MKHMINVVKNKILKINKIESTFEVLLNIYIYIKCAYIHVPCSFFFDNRDFSNGYLVAEIFSWYFPRDFHMHSYDNGVSLAVKQSNWSQIERVSLIPCRNNRSDLK